MSDYETFKKDIEYEHGQAKNKRWHDYCIDNQYNNKLPFSFWYDFTEFLMKKLYEKELT